MFFKNETKKSIFMIRANWKKEDVNKINKSMMGVKDFLIGIFHLYDFKHLNPYNGGKSYEIKKISRAG